MIAKLKIITESAGNNREVIIVPLAKMLWVTVGLSAFAVFAHFVIYGGF